MPHQDGAFQPTDGDSLRDAACRDESESLDQCVRECVGGDLNRFEEIVRICEPKVRGVLAAMIPDSDRVPDLTQDTFIIAYRRLSTYHPGTNFPAWIRTIARNVAQNERRRWYRRQEAQPDCQAEAERCIAENIDRFFDSLPEETLESLRNCVGRLGGRTRTLVERHYFEGCPVKTLSEALKVSVTAAKVALHRGRQALGQCLQRKGAM